MPPGSSNTRLKAGLILVIAGAGVLYSTLEASRADRERRTDLLQEARLVAKALDIQQISPSSDAGAANPAACLQLKAQFAALQSGSPQYRRVYLLGRNPDRSVFSIAESNSATSSGSLLADPLDGRVVDACGRVFATRQALIEGPFDARGAKWVTALVPVFDPRTMMCGLATPADAKAMVAKAVEFYRNNGRGRLLEELNNPQGAFCHGDLYAFAYDRGMTMRAHPVKPELIGQNQIDKKDSRDGKFFRKEIQQVARSKGHGWVEFEYPNPLNGQHDQKTTYVEAVDDLIVCAGAYKGEGAILGVLGVDVDARLWNQAMVRPVLAPVLTAIALEAVFLLGSALFSRRSSMGSLAPHPVLPLESGLTVAAGVVLSLFAAWMVQEREMRDRRQAFAQLAGGRMEAVAETLNHLRYSELEGLARFCENCPTLGPREFERFSAFLANDSAVEAWEWIPAVPARDKGLFEREARSRGVMGFEIWEKDRQGKRAPASGRGVYYPVYLLAPVASNNRALGYDLGSEPVRRTALEAAARTGLSASTDPIALVQETGNQTGMLIFRPVFSLDNPRRLRGMALAVLRMGTTLKTARPDDSVVMELSLMRRGSAPELLATSWAGEGAYSKVLAATRPMFAFGKVFTLTAHAGQDFMRLSPGGAGKRAGLAGLLVTAALAALASMLLRRREELEGLVVERTAELRESELRHRLLLQTGSDGIHVLDDRGNVVEANDAFCQMLGYTHKELLGLNVVDWDADIPPEALRTLIPELMACPKMFETRHRAKDGHIREVEINARGVTLDNGRYLYASARDTTLRKAAEQELRKLWRAVEQTPATVVITDVKGNIEYVNPKFVEVTGFTVAEALGQNPRVLKSGLHPPSFYKDMWDALMQGKVWRGDIQNRRKNGELYWESASISPVRDEHERITHFVAIKEDITERRRITAELIRAKQEAELANQAKSEFLANMSHEIRTPITGVIGMLQLLQRTNLNERQARYSTNALSAAQTLLNLVGDVLDLSKIEAGKMDLEEHPFNPTEVMDGVMSLLMARAEAQGIELECKVDPDVPRRLLGDSNRLRQVLVNLLGNALKFTKAGKVTAACARGDPRSEIGPLRFEIRDTGCGIAPEKQGLIFDAFSQADNSTTRTYGGTGLGLSISRKLCQLMGGDIGVSSTPGQGSTFWFIVRFRPDDRDRAAAAETAPDDRKTADVARGAILLAEDNEINREVVSETLTVMGYPHQWARNGREAVATWSEAEFALILMDCQMPEMDGYQAARAIRQAEADRTDSRRVPIIALTANATKGDRDRCLKAGMDDYLTKPLDADLLGRTIARWLSKAAPPGSPQIKAGGRFDAVEELLAPTPAVHGGSQSAGTGPLPVDYPTLIQRCMGDRELADSLVGKLEEQASRDVLEIANAVRQGNVAAMRAAAHRLKGAAANVAVEGLRVVAAELEEQGLAGNLAGAASRVELLEAELARLKQGRRN